MKIGVEISIDVTKIDKARLYQGQKGKYLTLTAFIDIDQKDQYENNGFITQKRTKEEDEAKTQLPILGNSKVFWSDGASAPAAPAAPAAPQAAANPYAAPIDDDLPF